MTAGKVLAIVWPIALFVLIGFEHSVANFYLFAQGAVAGADLAVGAVAGNLVLVTLGNVIGGAGGVALAYWVIYGSGRG